MSYPAGWSTVPVTGTYIGIDGNPAAGEVSFTSPQVILRMSGTTTVVPPRTITVTLDVNGHFATTLPATDDPNASPVGWVYEVFENVTNGRRFLMQVPHASTGIDMATVVPAGTPPPYPPIYNWITAAQLASTDGVHGSNMVGYLPSGTGAVGRTVQAKLRDTVSALDFGVKGDGVTDDASALQAAINYLGDRGGGILDCTMMGTMAIGSTIMLGNGTATAASTYNGVHLLGSGGANSFSAGTFTGLKWIGGAGGSMVEIAGPVSDCGLDGTWILNGAGAANYGVVVNQGVDCTFGTLEISGCLLVYFGFTNQNVSDPYGGVRNNRVNRLVLRSIPASAVGVNLDAPVNSPGNCLQNWIGIIDCQLASVTSIGVQFGWADFNRIDILDVYGSAGIGISFIRNASGHDAFFNSIGLAAVGGSVLVHSPSVPFGNTVDMWDVPDSLASIPNATGLSGRWTNSVGANPGPQGSFSRAGPGWQVTTPAVPAANTFVTNNNPYPVSIFPDGGSGALVLDIHGTGNNLPSVPSMLILESGCQVRFVTPPTAWIWYGLGI